MVFMKCSIAPTIWNDQHDERYHHAPASNKEIDHLSEELFPHKVMRCHGDDKKFSGIVVAGDNSALRSKAQRRIKKIKMIQLSNLLWNKTDSALVSIACLKSPARFSTVSFPVPK
jgi:hypothetical protein